MLERVERVDKAGELAAEWAVHEEAGCWGAFVDEDTSEEEEAGADAAGCEGADFDGEAAAFRGFVCSVCEAPTGFFFRPGN